MYTQSQYNASKQALRHRHIKINVLDFEFNTIGSLEGNANGGQIQIDANSDIRRTCNMSLVVTDSSLEVQAGGEIFIDKYIQIYIGDDDVSTGEIAWVNMGIYLINQPSYTYDFATHTLTFDGVDLMAKLTGQRNGYIANLAGDDIAKVEAGQNVREVIIGILQENGFERYVVEECRLANGVIQEVPYDMEFEQGSTWYDMLSELRNILPQYQIYFDVDGVFHYDQIPMSDADPIMIDSDIWEANVISENIAIDFESVKNAVEVYGVTHDTEYYSDATVSTVSGYAVTLTVTTEEETPISKSDYNEVAFTLPSEASGGDITINLNEWGDMPLVLEDGTAITELKADTYYVISYRVIDEEQETGYWIFLGGLQAHGYWEDSNPESPFYVGGSTGKILIPLYGDEYDNIQSDDLALQRAKYEIYRRCRLNDTIQLTTVPVYWADVNWKVSYAPKNGDIVNQYIVQSVYMDLSESGNQTWELSRSYSFYPVI